MTLTDIEKNLYNDFLIASRSSKNKPFKIRQNFDTIQPKVYNALKKLSAFFQRNKHIQPKEFFIAPYCFYKEDEYFNIDFFVTTKAIKCYTLYKEQQERDDPDSLYIINKCKECCKFIYEFCKDRKLTLNEYKTLINGTTPIILQHLKDHNINFYTVHALDCEKIFRNIESDLLCFFIKDFNDILAETRLKFQKSTQLKIILRKALNIIEEELLKKK